jgi:predicted MFS family arabinose efflux permease
VVGDIEDQVRRYTGSEELPPIDEDETITIEQRRSIGFGIILRAMFQMYPRRTVLGLILMSTQAFLYTAVLFTYALVLSSFYRVSAANAPYYLAAFAIGNLAGPLLLGRLFDRVGRVPMISGCYIAAGAILALTSYLFSQDLLDATTLTGLWTVMFYLRSAHRYGHQVEPADRVRHRGGPHDRSCHRGVDPRRQG